ncbi:MAG: hypothetical protein PVF17_05205 [Ignavibacteria bacterium]|jgi:hypothetical protein
MEIFFPDNIFAHSLATHLNKQKQNKITFISSALLSKKMNDTSESIALIPTMELITNQDLFVSRSIGIAFEGTMSNSYIYFNTEREQISEVQLAGDVSSIDVVMCKILFSELYDTNVELKISAMNDDLEDQTHIIVGDQNFKNRKYKNGISFAEQIVDLISAPYINYILASRNEELLKNYSDDTLPIIKEFALGESEHLDELDESKNFIIENSQSVIYCLEEQDIIGINELIRLPFYHGILKELFEVKFV